MPHVLITRNIPQPALDRIRAGCTVRQWESDDPIERAELLAQVAGVDGLFCLLTERIDGELLDAAGPTLKVVSTMSVGYDHVDVPALAARGVRLGNTPGVLTETTADLALALLLAAARPAARGVGNGQGRRLGAVAPSVADRKRPARQHGEHCRPGPDRRGGWAAAMPRGGKLTTRVKLVSSCGFSKERR